MTQKSVKASLVGIRFYVSTAELNKKIKSASLTLKKEPFNEFDSNAIAVLMYGNKIGHIDRKSAPKVGSLLDLNGTYKITVREIFKGSISLSIKYDDGLSKIARKTPKKYEAPDGKGIYLISVSDGKYVYIGQSNFIKKRIQSHWNDLSSNTHANSSLQSLWSEYGESSFSIKILEQIPSEIKSGLVAQRWLADKEKFWIKEYKKIAICINKTDGEAIPTKKAKKELVDEEKTHDKLIKKEKSEINSEINDLQEKQQQLSKSILYTNEKIKNIEIFLKKNTGIISFFSKTAEKKEIDENKKELDYLKRINFSYEKEYNLIRNKISLLKEKRRKLKTTKQIKNAEEYKLIRMGVNPYRNNKNIHFK